MKQEPAEEFLQLKPDIETTLEKDGFIGALYRPEIDKFVGKALVVVGGSDGYYSLTRLISEQFVKKGMTVLSLAYWNQEGLNRKCSHIPIEIGELAGKWLIKKGYVKIGIWGISLGSEFALLCGSYMPDIYSCVTAVNPICVCAQGIQKKSPWVEKTALCEGSTFSYRGKDIPYALIDYNKTELLKDMIKHKEVRLRSCYDRVFRSKEKSGLIQVENINGPVLFLAADHDSMWPSKESCDYMVERLKEKEFPHPVEYYHYEMASHFLLPYSLKSRKIYRIERQHREECDKSNMDAFKKTLEFLKKQW